MNQASVERLSKVHPELARRVTTMVSALGMRGVIVEVVQGLRTFAEQDALFAKGRSRPGPTVTNARAGQSNHNYGLAVDVCPFENAKPNWAARGSLWNLIGEEAEKAGLEWGGRWRTIVDKPHVQIAVSLTVTDCLAIYRRGGLAAVWAEVDRLLKIESRCD